MPRSHHLILAFCAVTLSACSSVSNINDELHSGVGGLIDKGSNVAGSVEQNVGKTLQRFEFDSQVYLTALRDDADTIVEAWVEEGQYGLALATIDQLRASHPKYEQLQHRRPEIASQAAAYEQHIIRLAHEDMEEQQWDQALQRYEQALSILPDSQPLRDGQLAVHDRQASHAARLQRQLDYSEGSRLVESLRLQRHALEINPRDDASRLALEKNRRKASRLAQALLAHAHAELEEKQYDPARRHLTLALELDPDIQADEAFDALQQQEAQSLLQQGRRQLKQGRYRRARESFNRARTLHDSPEIRDALTELGKQESRKSRTDLVDLHLRYEQALTANRLPEAKKLLRQIRSKQGNTEQTALLQAELDQRISRAISYHLSQASRHYSQDRFEQAVMHWNKVLKLDPHHELARQRVERAQRIVDKLEQLRQKQP